MASKIDNLKIWSGYAWQNVNLRLTQRLWLCIHSYNLNYNKYQIIIQWWFTRLDLFLLHQKQTTAIPRTSVVFGSMLTAHSVETHCSAVYKVSLNPTADDIKLCWLAAPHARFQPYTLIRNHRYMAFTSQNQTGRASRRKKPPELPWPDTRWRITLI